MKLLKKIDIDSGFDWCTVVVVARLEPEELKDPQGAFVGEYLRNCNCAHDCCGHWFNYFGKAKHRKRRRYSIEIRYHRNV